MELMSDKEREEKVKKQIRSLRRVALAIFIVPMIIFVIIFAFLIKTRAADYEYDKHFGVFIGIGRKDIDKLDDYHTVIIDAELFTEEGVYLSKHRLT